MEIGMRILVIQINKLANEITISLDLNNVIKVSY